VCVTRQEGYKVNSQTGFRISDGFWEALKHFGSFVLGTVEYKASLRTEKTAGVISTVNIPKGKISLFHIHKFDSILNYIKTDYILQISTPQLIVCSQTFDLKVTIAQF